MVDYYGLNPAWALTLPLSALLLHVGDHHSAIKFTGLVAGENGKAGPRMFAATD